jgi:CRISPR-associated protein Cas2
MAKFWGELQQMKKFNFLICYDIADPKRLAKIAKNLEKVSIRIQKSIFYYVEATARDIEQTVMMIEQIINNDEDDVRVYKIDKNSSINLKKGIDLKKPNIIKG